LGQKDHFIKNSKTTLDENEKTRLCFKGAFFCCGYLVDNPVQKPVQNFFKKAIDTPPEKI
jgi:hypothetical protein